MKRPSKLKDILAVVRAAVVRAAVVRAAVESGQLVYSDHANSRMSVREIIKPEIEHVLKSGFHEAKKDQFSSAFEAWDYAIRGKTVDGRALRIVVAMVQPRVLVVTAIDLDKED